MTTFKPIVIWPSYEHDASKLPTLDGNLRGIDMEWNVDTGVLTILGLSNGTRTFSVPYKEGRDCLAAEARRDDRIWVGHNLIQADREELIADGITLPTNARQLKDTIILHWLLNPHLCKTERKASAGDDEGERKGRGFMSIWHMASLYSNYSNWKDCRGAGCSGPCPKCAPFWYNSLDTLVPAQVLSIMEQQAALRGVDKLYPLHVDVALVLAEMTRIGVQVDVPYLERLRGDFLRDKETLASSLPFNPNSTAATTPKKKGALAPPRLYFKERYGLTIPDCQEATIRDIAEENPTIPELQAWLDYKELGNGPDRWFGPEYLRDDGTLHGAFGMFTSSGRLMSSRPNMQNVGRRRLDRTTGESIGNRLRKAVIARDGYWLVKADYSSAENYVYLYLAGEEIPRGVDLHTWMKENMGLQEDDPFSLKLGGAREAAKSVTHACLAPGHEVLTPAGWIAVEAYEEGTPIAQWKEDFSVNFVLPSRFWQYEVDEPLREIRGTSLFTLVTRNHTLPVLTSGTWNGREYRTWHKAEVESLPKSGRIPLVGVLKDEEETLTDKEVLQAVALQADAAIRSPAYAAFHLIKERKIRRLREIFGKQLRGDSPCGCHENGRRIGVSFKSPILSGKGFNANVLLMSQRQRLLFLDEILNWDGCRRKNSPDEAGLRCYDNTDLESVLWVQTVAHISGQEALLRPWIGKSGFRGTKQGFRLTFNRRQYAQVNRLEKNLHGYQGPVYCFTVPSGFFLVRYGKHIHVTGNSDYLEGINLLVPSKLRESSTRNLVAAGALRIFPDWQLGDLTVAFTGVNLARRAFGNASWENRRRALDAQERYFSRFPRLRDLQKRILKQMYEEKAVRPPTGHVLLSYGDLTERCKTAAAVWGSNPVAFFMKHAIVRAKADGRLNPRLTVHDELLFEVDKRYDLRDVKRWITDAMVFELAEMPGFTIPIKVSYGRSWAEQETV